MKPIAGYPNYSVTKSGQVWSKPRQQSKGGFLKPILRGKNNYLCVSLCKSGRCKTSPIHHLVLEAYIGPCPNGMGGRHLDGNKFNNTLGNLCWGTQKENIADAIKHGTRHPPNGENHWKATLTSSDVLEIRRLYATGKYSQYKLAKLFGVGQVQIWNIVNKKQWKHLLC